MTWIHQLRTIPTWKKYSQAHEESYIDFILQHIEKKNDYILEFGAWDGYHLSNTRYFIEKGYKALLIDGDNHGNAEVKQHFIRLDNVLEILSLYETPLFFDMLCLDLDGNDHYILDEILKNYTPSLVVCEFNPIWEAYQSMRIQYDPNHVWNNDDYYGFSFLAGIKMFEKHGYTCVHQNDNLNMYFVHNEPLAKSLQMDASMIKQVVPAVKYEKTHYHPASPKTTWEIYEP